MLTIVYCYHYYMTESGFVPVPLWDQSLSGLVKRC